MTPRPPTRCRRCGAPVHQAQETGVRIAFAALVDAEPLSPLTPLERSLPDLTVWEHHPRHGWACLDMPVRHGWPIHLQHNCKPTYKPTSTKENTP